MSLLIYRAVCSTLQKLSSEERKKILLDIADALEANEDAIRSENEADVEAAQGAGYEKSLIARMTLKPGKVVFHFILLPFSFCTKYYLLKCTNILFLYVCR